jgi:hypothetical protein
VGRARPGASQGRRVSGPPLSPAPLPCRDAGAPRRR